MVIVIEIDCHDLLFSLSIIVYPAALFNWDGGLLDLHEGAVRARGLFFSLSLRHYIISELRTACSHSRYKNQTNCQTCFFIAALYPSCQQPTIKVEK